jgi:signal transduction histidine kinase
MAEKLEATLADLKSERDTVTRVLQSRRDLIANVSHELRTPVATLQAAIETTLDKWQDSTPDEVRHKLGIMDAEVKQLSVLIDDLFTLAQADVNNLSVVCMSIQLTPLIQQVVDIFAPLAWNSTRVEVTADLPADLSPVQADAMRLQQVLLNLLRNGARHTPPGGIVAIMAEEEDATVRIEVRDTGEGIDPNDLPHIWERFYRGKQAAADSAGLGLALVKELVEAMDGSIGVESEIGQGSRFVLRLKKA